MKPKVLFHSVDTVLLVNEFIFVHDNSLHVSAFVPQPSSGY